ncbi:MAG: PASTA domain-containing protein [Solirubrobacteraceae bacterium]
MRVCSSCGRENPDDRDFCECGEYLRWDPTGVVQAVTPEVLQAAQQQAPAADAAAPAADAPAAAPAQPEAPAPGQATTQPPHPAARPAAAPAPSSPANGQGAVVSGDPLAGSAPAPPPPPAAAAPHPVPTAPQPAVPAAPVPAPPPPAQPAEPDPAAISLRLPEGEQVSLGETLAMGVEPGQRARVLALVRNQSGIVDNYELSVLGLPGDWWSIYPNTVYLVPFGTSGTYEQEVEIHIHPPRSAEAEARMWELEVVGESKAYSRRAATAPLRLGIQPFEEFKTKLAPERASGRKKAQFDVAVRNTANAPVTVALDAADPDNELEYRFTPATMEIPPGQSISSKMLVKPPRQKWIGRPAEKRIQVFTKTGEEAEQAKSAADMELPEGEGEEGEEGGGAPKRKGLKQRLRITGPRAQVGTSGVRLQGPRVAKPRIPSKNVDLMKLKAPGSGAPAAQMPLMPNQVVFRHKAWLPWWIALLVPLLILLALFLFLFLPKNVVVPEVTGAKSTFEAEKKLTDAQLKLSAATKQKVSTEAPPGTVIGQTPKAGQKAKKDSEVAIEIAVGNGKVEVPDIVGKTQADADPILRKANLTVGQVSPQPPDPKAKISSQIPAAKEIVKEGAPIAIFTADPRGKKKGKGKVDKKNGKAGGAGATAAAVLPALAGTAVAEAGQKAAEAGLVPETVNQFSGKKKGTLIGTIPPAGTKLAEGAKIKLIVSAGFPELAFDDGKNVLLADGSNGKRLPAVAKGSQEETDPTFSFDGTQIAYASDRRVFIKNQAKPDEPAIAVTPPDEVFSDLAWAPTLDLNLLAMLRDKSPGKDHKDQDLCLLQLSKTQGPAQCISDPTINLVKTVRWTPDGKTIYALGQKGDINKPDSVFGMVRYTSKKPFSADAKDWGKGKFVTDISNPGKGVIDFSISPDGKRMAAVANFDTDAFQLYLGKPKDVLLTEAKAQNVRACKVAWRSDGLELVVVQADQFCGEANGQLARMPVGQPTKQQSLGFSGDNPVFQPLSLG